MNEIDLEETLIPEEKIPEDAVGPVLMKSDMAENIIKAIAIDNPTNFIGVIDRGSYFRVVGRKELILTKKTLEEIVGRKMRFPGEVEVFMSSFAGRIDVNVERIRWWLEK